MPESFCHLIPIEIEYSRCFVVFGHYLQLNFGVIEYDGTAKMIKKMLTVDSLVQTKGENNSLKLS